MTQAASSRGLKTAVALAAVGLAAWMWSRWIGWPEPPAGPSRGVDAPARATATVTARVRVPTPPVAEPRGAGEAIATPTTASSATRPTVVPFDFATMGSAGRREGKKEERFVTNQWFTEDDLRHPDRYFELAERMPELNRPEERRDTLEFFLAYRQKLNDDLAAAGDDPSKRAEIQTVIDRYDAAIARLRPLIEEK
jgi:hypothetical protein